MIAGVGTDILEIARIAKAIARTSKLPQRILTPEELERFNSSKNQPRFLAKRFAAKEAVAKALGTGIARGVSWQHMTLGREPEGRPLMLLTGGARARADKMGVTSVHISISDEQDYVVAFAILDMS